MRARTRTVLAVVLFVPLAAILLMTFACLPAPVGDAETAKVDDSLTGAWIANPKDEDPVVVVVVVRPMDKHTYFVQYLQNVKKDGGEEAVKVLNYRAWLSQQGGATFITCETLDNRSFLTPGTDNDLYYWVAKVQKTADGISLFPIKDNADLLKDLDTQAKIEPVIAANANNPELYSEAITFKKIDKDHMDMVGLLTNKAHIGIGGK